MTAASRSSSFYYVVRIATRLRLGALLPEVAFGTKDRLFRTCSVLDFAITEQ